MSFKFLLILSLIFLSKITKYLGKWLHIASEIWKKVCILILRENVDKIIEIERKQLHNWRMKLQSFTYLSTDRYALLHKHFKKLSVCYWIQIHNWNFSLKFRKDFTDDILLKTNLINLNSIYHFSRY